VFILLFVNFWASYPLTVWGRVPAPDAVHSYGIRFRGGGWRYYRSWAGFYIIDRFFWLHFALLAVAFLVAALQRDSFRRVEPTPLPSGPVNRSPRRSGDGASPPGGRLGRPLSGRG